MKFMFENEEKVNEEIKEAKEKISQESITVENSNTEILGNEKTKEVKVEEDSTKLIFFKRVLSGVIDQIILIALSLILLLVFNGILKLVGFYIAEREPMFFILYVITNILYGPICKLSKLNTTIGTKINFK